MSSTEHDDLPQAHGAAIAKVPTYILGVDEVLMGGLPAGRTTLVAGGPGTGKTMLGLEFLYRTAKAGEPGIYVTFEERAEAVRENARSVGWDLESLEQSGKLALVPAEVPPELVLSGEFSVDGLLAILAGQAQALEARHVVIDAVDVLMRVFRDPLRQQSQFQLVHRWLQDRNMTAVLTAKAEEDQLGHHPHLDYMADCVLRLDQHAEGQVSRRRMRVLKYRGSGFLRNEHPYDIASTGFVMMPVMTATLVQHPLGPPASMGGERVDAILGGGFRRASSALVAGSSGTGKTTFASTFALAACERDERVLYVSFEDSQEALISSLLSPGIDLRPALDSGQLKILTALPESMGVEHHLLRIFEVLEQFGPEHVVVDAISACHRMGSDQAAFEFLVRLLTWCKARGITCLCTNQTPVSSAPEQISGFGISSLMDTLVLLEQIQAPTFQRRMLVIKSRGMSHAHAHHPFAITDEGLSFSEAQSQATEPAGIAGEGAHERDGGAR